MALVDMRPVDTSNNEVDRLDMYAIATCKRVLRFSSRVPLTDVPHLLLRQSRTWMPFSPVMAFLSNLVLHVVRDCPKEQVRWLYAWWVIAVMANLHIWWNRSKVQFPRKPMREVRLPYLAPDVQIGDAVTIRVARSQPFTTSARWCRNASGEVFSKASRFALFAQPIAAPSTILTASRSQLRKFRSECYAAGSARARLRTKASFGAQNAAASLDLGEKRAKRFPAASTNLLNGRLSTHRKEHPFGVTGRDGANIAAPTWCLSLYLGGAL